MEIRRQPHPGPVEPEPAPDVHALLAAGWRAALEECWIVAPGIGARLVSPETWRALRERTGFVRTPWLMQ